MRTTTLHRLWAKAGVCWLALLVSACAGFRGGWQSVAYIGNAPSLEREDGPLALSRVLQGEGVEPRLTLDSQLRTCR